MASNGETAAGFGQAFGRLRQPPGTAPDQAPSGGSSGERAGGQAEPEGVTDYQAGAIFLRQVAGYLSEEAERQEEDVAQRFANMPRSTAPASFLLTCAGLCRVAANVCEFIDSD